MLGRKKTTTVLERDLAQVRSRAGEVAGDVAERAVEAAGKAAGAARGAGRSAAPVIRSAAHSAAGTLSEAAEKAAEVLAETADRLANTEVSTAARQKLADRAEEFASTIRPKKKRRILRKLFVVGALAGGITALVRSPLKSKIADRLWGSPASEEPEAITLPVPDSSAASTAPPSASSSSPSTAAGPPSAAGSAEPSGPPSASEADGAARERTKTKSSEAG